MLIFSFIFFILGLLAPIVLFVILFVGLCAYTAHFKKIQRNVGKISSLKRPFVYGTQTTIQWVNALTSKIYPQIVTPKFLHHIINSQIPKIIETTAIESLTVMNIDMKGREPVIKYAKLVTSLDTDYVALSFKYYPNLLIHADCIVKYIKSFSVGITFTLDSIEGAIDIQIPESKGNAKTVIEDSTSIQMDIGANVANMVTISTEGLGLVWDSLISVINSIIHGITISIPIEKVLIKKNKKKEKKPSIFKTKWIIKKEKLFSDELLPF